MASQSGVLPGQTRAAELRRAAACVPMGIALLAICRPWGSVDYYYVPLITGGGMALVAVAGGRGGRLMGPALPVLFWGAAKVLTANFHFTGDYALTTGMIGLGVITAWALNEAKLFPSNNFAVGAGIVWIALGQFIHGQYNEWVTYYAALLFGTVALAELASISTARHRPSHLPAETVPAATAPEPVGARQPAGRR